MQLVLLWCASAHRLAVMGHKHKLKHTQIAYLGRPIICMWLIIMEKDNIISFKPATIH